MTDGGVPHQRHSPAMLQFLQVVLRQRRTILLCVGIVVGLTALFVIRRPRQYTATAAFMPSTPDRGGQLGQLAGLASELGLEMDIGRRDQTAFYTSLVHSREILERVIVDTYTVRLPNGEVRHGDLIKLLRVKGDSLAERRWKAVKRLRRRVTVRGSRATNIVEMRVVARYPDLAESVAERILARLNEFDLRRRQLLASTELQFTESRIAAAESSLAREEGALARFMYRNRTYENSPALVLEYDRLTRRVSLHQQVLTSLVQSAERSRIDQARNTSVIVLLEHPRGSAIPRPRGRVLKLILATFFGMLLGIGIALVRESIAQARQNDPVTYSSVAALAQESVRGLRRIARKR